VKKKLGPSFKLENSQAQSVGANYCDVMASGIAYNDGAASRMITA
jgi:hypothetical protein